MVNIADQLVEISWQLECVLLEVLRNAFWKGLGIGVGQQNDSDQIHGLVTSAISLFNFPFAW